MVMSSSEFPSTDGLTGRASPAIDRPASMALGDLLSAARERRGVTLQQIADESRIPRRHLEALERGDLAAVPSGPYRRGEVIAFAKIVGLDQHVALRHLESALAPAGRDEDSTPDLTRNDHGPQRTPATVRTVAAVSALALAAVIATVMWSAEATLPPETVPPEAVPRPTQSTPRSETTSSTTASPSRDLPTSTGGLPADENVDARPVASSGEAIEDPATTGRRLVISSEPQGARVTVDDIGWGTTPLSLTNLTPGTKRIRVTRDGYSAVERTVRIVADGATTIRFTLHPTAEAGP